MSNALLRLSYSRKFDAIQTILQSDETFASASNLIVPIITMCELFQQELYKQYAFYFSDIIEKIIQTIHLNLKNRQYAIIDQQLFDTIAKSYPIGISTCNIIIVKIFYEILLSSQNLSYDNALQIYADAITQYQTSANIAPIPQHMIIKLVKHKTLPLSEQDTLNIIQYPDIAMPIFNEIKDCFTYTYNVLYEIIIKSRYYDYQRYTQIIESRRQEISEVTMSTVEYFNVLVNIEPYHQGLLRAYVNNRTRNNMDDVRKFIHPLIRNNQELLCIYMQNNALQFTIDDLEFACSELNAMVVQEIVNSNVLPNKKCIESVLQYVDARNSCLYPDYESARHIIAIFIHCGRVIPKYTLQRVLQSAKNISTADMRAIYKYGFTSPNSNNPILDKIPDSD